MIYDILPVNNYAGNGVSTVFDFDFYIDNPTQLKVYLYDENGVKFQLENEIDYTLTYNKNQNGGNIKFPVDGSSYSILSSDQKISLVLDIPVSQETQFNNSSLLNFESLEYSFDYLTRLIQILKRKLSLCVKVEECSDNTPEELIDLINNANVNTTINASESLKQSELARNSAISANKSLEVVKDVESHVYAFYDEIKENGMYKFNLFDTKISDHILEGIESKGWALQGTYVSKTLYPDFYNRCLNEFNNSTLNTEQTEAWVQPVLTSDGIMGGDSFAVCGANGNSAYNAWDGDDNTWVSLTSNGVNETYFYNPKPLRINSLELTYYPLCWITNGEIYGSNDNENYTLLTTFSHSSENGTIELNCNDFYKYYKIKVIAANGSNGSINVIANIYSINIDAVIPSEVIYKNSNGHKFYNITDKEKIDEIYDTYGIAEFYGIDFENEKIFLPRNKYFYQLTDDPSKVNEMIEAGLPNITGSHPICCNYGSASGAFEFGSSFSGNGSSACANKYVKFDASKSSSIYGNSDTVQPQSVLKLLYYCVGNTVVNENKIDAGVLVSQMELKANRALDNILPSLQAKSEITSWGIPDYSAGISVGSIPVADSPFVAPTNGLLYVNLAVGSGATSGRALCVNGVQMAFMGSSGRFNQHIALNKGDKFYAPYTVEVSLKEIVFFPLKGVN